MVLFRSRGCVSYYYFCERVRRAEPSRRIERQERSPPVNSLPPILTPREILYLLLATRLATRDQAPGSRAACAASPGGGGGGDGSEGGCSAPAGIREAFGEAPVFSRERPYSVPSACFTYSSVGAS